MRIIGTPSRIALIGALLVGLAVVVAAPQAVAQSKGKSIQTEGKWVQFDSDAATVTIKILKPGKRPKLKEAGLKKGKEATFDVKPEGSVLTRTTVAVNGKKGEITDIPEGKTVIIYWVEDPAKGTKRFARKIDVIFSEEELAERYGFED